MRERDINMILIKSNLWKSLKMTRETAVKDKLDPWSWVYSRCMEAGSDLPPFLGLAAALEAQDERVRRAHHLQLVLHLLTVFGLVHHLTSRQLHLQQGLEVLSTLKTLQVTKKPKHLHAIISRHKSSALLKVPMRCYDSTWFLLTNMESCLIMKSWRVHWPSHFFLHRYSQSRDSGTGRRQGWDEPHWI